jgi:octaheme c-type cytochrome (tetrathionate reductase family)
MKKVLFVISFLLTISVVSAQETKVNGHKDNVVGPFNTPQEVTKACLECHEEAGNQILETRHWNWAEAPSKVKDGVANLGKKNLINNYCVAIPSNWARCTSCHIGYGWKDANFDFKNKENIDCLVCHDQTGSYTKTPTAAGMPDAKVNLLDVAQNVGKTNRQNCGNCHFYGGGDEAVKHGDMDGSLLNPTADFDVHMGGKNFTCSECHKSENHSISGRSHGSRAMGTGTDVNCESCHTGEIHKNKTLNKHTATIACQTCHIPTYAKEVPTKTYWDWSTAGTDAKVENDEFGKPNFDKKKGHFKRGKNLTPEYKWYNKSASYYQLGDKLDPNKVLVLNPLNSTIADKNAKIAPFKVMRGKQPIDAEQNIVVVPHLFGKEGFWNTYNWIDATNKGMASLGMTFSGKLGWVETEMNWPINHMVVPAKKALKCTSCHGEKATLMDWKALGYPGDPKKAGSREKLGLVK